MELEVEETGPVERRLRIEIPTAEVDAAFETVFRGFGKQARIKGFRRGKIPRPVLERYFGAQAGGEVFQHLVQESLPRALEQAELAVMGEPRLEPGDDPAQGAPFSYVVTLEIRPEIDLGKVKGLALKRPVLPEPEQDPVEAHLEELRLAQGHLVEEPPDTLTSRGHVAVLDYDATIGGEPFEGSSGRESTVEIGAGRSIPGFEDQLAGMRCGEERDFELELPDSYPEAIAGKTAAFHVRVLELKRRELPQLDDEFAKDVSDFATLEELRADLDSRVKEGRSLEERRLLREAVIDAVIEANPFPVPERLVDRQLQSRVARAISPFREKLEEERLREMAETWHKEWRPRAERDVCFALLVPEVAKAESIEVTPDDVDARLAELAEERGESVTQLKSSYKEKGLLDALASGILEERVVEFLLSEATLSDS